MAKFSVTVEVNIPSTQVVEVEAIDEKHALSAALSKAKVTDFKLVKWANKPLPLLSSKVEKLE